MTELPRGNRFLFAAIVVAGLSVPRLAAGQEFAAASIKLAPASDHFGGMKGGPGTPDPGQFICQSSPLWLLIARAWDLQSLGGEKPIQLVAPQSVFDDKYTIVARIPGRVTNEEFLLMIRNLLIERLGLTYHKEMRELPVYEATVANGGLKMKPAEKAPDGAVFPTTWDMSKTDDDGYPQIPPGIPFVGANAKNGNCYTTGRMQSISSILRFASDSLGQTVIDKTGLTGDFDFHIVSAGCNSSRAASAGQGMVEASDPGSDILVAMEKQLGLHLARKKGPVEVMVIDHVRREPSDE